MERSQFVVDVSLGRVCGGRGVVHVDQDGLTTNLTHCNCVEGQVLYVPSTAQSRLDPDSAPCVVEDAIMCKQVFDATGHLAANDDATESTIRDAVAYMNVFAGAIHPPTIFVQARFYRNAIVARIHVAAFDEDVLAGAWIDAIIVWAMGQNFNGANDDVFAIDRMDRPERSILDRYAFDQDVAAVDRLNE